MALGNLFQKFKAGLGRTAQAFTGRLRSLIGRKVDQNLLDDLETILIGADIGVKATDTILERVKTAFAQKEATQDLISFVKNEMRTMLRQETSGLTLQPKGPTVVMVAGVNGSGKTTSIAKLATRLTKEGKKVMVGASDTFRAAATEQLETWAGRVGVPIVKGQAGSDPSAVAHDACSAALARDMDVLIVDTAGRQHTHGHLMRELEKIHRVIGKVIPGAPHEVLLVLDATNGQNAIRQATEFTKAVHCTGIILSKLDGTAKGGSVVAIRQQLGLPVRYIGVGEGADDLEVFDADSFVEALFAA